MASSRFIIAESVHNDLVAAVYRARGYGAEESAVAAKWCGLASRHGIKTHAAIKALHLEEHLGQSRRLCVPNAKLQELPSRFGAVVRVDAHHMLGQPLAEWAMDRCCDLADKHGVGVVVVDNAFHYLWGGGYVMEAARRGYIAYTSATSGLAEVVPFGGTFPTIGTNPHSWGLPTTDIVGFPIVIDWATSAIAMGRVQQCLREGLLLPPETALDEAGVYTTDPSQVKALVPFGGSVAGHKGYGLGLLIELIAAYAGASLPTLRGLPVFSGSKGTMTFYFQAIHPEAISGGDFRSSAHRDANVKAVIDDILGHGNDLAILPGQREAAAAKDSQRAGGLILTAAEVTEMRRVLDIAKIPVPDHAFVTSAD